MTRMFCDRLPTSGTDNDSGAPDDGEVQNDLTPATARVHQSLANADHHFANGDLESCCRELKHATETMPEEPELRVAYGSILHQLSAYQEAREEFRAALAHRPDHARTLTLLATTCLKLEDLEGFEAALGHALQLGSGNLEAWYLFADLSTNAGKHADAIRAYQRILEATPKDILVHLKLGQSLFANADYAEAQQCYSKELEIEPGNEIARDNLAVVSRKICQLPSPPFPVTPPPAPISRHSEPPESAGGPSPRSTQPAAPSSTGQKSDAASILEHLDSWLTEKLHDAEFVAWKLATESTAKYINRHMHQARIFTSPTTSNRHDFESRKQLLQYALNAASPDGLVLEFGVHQGETINVIAEGVPSDRLVHGFDSFEGLPESWFLGREPGRFSTGGRLPLCRNNVRLYKGWFHQTLPPFLRKQTRAFSFVHIDSDLYSSARDILYLARDRFVAGTVLVFDEYFNYPGWEQHEFRAFQEFIRDRGQGYKYLAMAPRHYSVAVQLL